jgi:hypothetical protein
VFPTKSVLGRSIFSQENPWLVRFKSKRVADKHVWQDMHGELKGWEAVTGELESKKLGFEYQYTAVYPGRPSGEGGYTEAAWQIDSTYLGRNQSNDLAIPPERAKVSHDISYPVDDRVAIIRGGGKNSAPRMARARTRYFKPIAKRDQNVGFRCVFYSTSKAGLKKIFSRNMRTRNQIGQPKIR